MVFWICLTHACTLLEDKTIDDDYQVFWQSIGLVNDTAKCKYIVELTRTQALTDIDSLRIRPNKATIMTNDPRYDNPVAEGLCLPVCIALLLRATIIIYSVISTASSIVASAACYIYI